MQTTAFSSCSELSYHFQKNRNLCQNFQFPVSNSCNILLTELFQSQGKKKFRAIHGASRIMCSSEMNQANGPNPAQSPSSGWYVYCVVLWPFVKTNNFFLPRSEDFRSLARKKWMAGIVLSVALPSVGHKYGPLLVLKNKIDTAIKTVESVTEAVEELAEETEKFIENVEEKLPENSKLKEALDSMESLAQEAEKEAKKAEKLIHQVEAIEKEVEATLLKTAADQGIRPKKE